MTERVQVNPSEIKVGDLIEVLANADESDSSHGSWYRGTVTEATPDSVKINARYSFVRQYNEEFNRIFYRLPKPAPQEPKGLGAVVQDNEGDYWVRVPDSAYPWSIGDDVRTWDNVVESYGPVKVLSDGYVPES